MNVVSGLLRGGEEQVSDKGNLRFYNEIISLKYRMDLIIGPSQ